MPNNPPNLEEEGLVQNMNAEATEVDDSFASPTKFWRWFNELQRPSLRCERIGHRRSGEWRRGYIPGEGGYFGGVACRTRQMREYCTRCGVETEPWRPIEGETRTIHSLSTSEDNWDRINAGGWWTDYGRCAPFSDDGDGTSSTLDDLGKSNV